MPTQGMLKQVEAETRPLPQPGEVWRHYKGGLYLIICVALREDVHREAVVYQALDGAGLIWVRDLCDWQVVITLTGGETCPRFTRVEPDTTSPTPPPPPEGPYDDHKPAGPAREQRGRH